jgi:mannose-6-phosphate isomerase-like protein (cupin superfamily)
VNPAILEFLDGLGVCHVCGDVLEIEPGDAVVYLRCDRHWLEVDDEEDVEPWHISAEEWARLIENYKKARRK